jgi:glycosyltransferase involved in cell wall biosynthesis
LAIIIPARNEESSVGRVLTALNDSPLAGVGTRRVFVIDDGSTDGTAAVARAAGASVLRHRANLGKGAALLTGCEAALGAGSDLIALMDADGQHEAADLPRLLQPLLDNEADLVLAARRFSRQMPPAMRLGNWGLSRAFALLFRRHMVDTQCGLRAFRAAAYPRLRWTTPGYGVETEMLIRAVRSHLRIAEVAIATVYHDRYKGTTVTDGVRIFGQMLRWTFGR